jgi:hypothetical protein
MVVSQTVSPDIMKLVFGRDPTLDPTFSKESWGVLEITPFNKKFREGYERQIWVPRDANRTKIQLAIYLVYRRCFEMVGFFPSQVDPPTNPIPTSNWFTSSDY